MPPKKNRGKPKQGQQCQPQRGPAHAGARDAVQSQGQRRPGVQHQGGQPRLQKPTPHSSVQLQPLAPAPPPVTNVWNREGQGPQQYSGQPQQHGGQLQQLGVQKQAQGQQQQPSGSGPPPGNMQAQGLSQAMSTMSVGGGAGALVTSDTLLWGGAKGSFENPFTSLSERKEFVGKAGRPIKLWTNHFKMSIGCQVVHRYDVKASFLEPWKRPVQRRDKEILYRAIEKLRADKLEDWTLIFDGMHNAYARQPLLQGNSKFEFQVQVPEHGDVDDSRDVTVKVVFEYTGKLDINAAIEAFKESGAQSYGDTAFNDAVLVLNLIMSYAVNVDTSQFVSLGRSYFSPAQGQATEIGGGKYVWHGTFQSIRVGWQIHLNIDMANKAGYKECQLGEFLVKFITDMSRGKDRDLSVLVSDRRKAEMASEAIRDLKCRFVRPDYKVRDYKMNGLKRGAKQEYVPDVGDTVFDYFRKTYNYVIKNPKWPLVHVGNAAKNILLPIECLLLKTQACPRSKALTAENTSAMIKVTAVRPNERQAAIKRNLQFRGNAFKNDPYAKAFGLSVESNFANVNGRVLDPPTLEYQATQGKPTGPTVKPRDGKWQMPNRAQFRDPKPLENWGVFVIAKRVDTRDVKNFCSMICDEASAMGMRVKFPKDMRRLQQLHCLQQEFEKFYNDLQNPQLIMVIVENKGDQSYRILKKIGDTQLKMPTSFVIQKNLGFGGQGPKPTVIHNIVRKLNSKLDGTNEILHPKSKQDANLGAIFDRPIIFMGADVTHPAPGSDVHPSIAAVVASCDPRVSIYNVEVRVQKHREGTQAIEQIMDMEDCAHKLLLKFFHATNEKKPERIVFYRDGVSEGQFEIVLNKEIAAIQRACKRLQEDYQPGITYFVAQKRHKTRLFPQQKGDSLKNGNVPPGTVVDTDITHPTVSSFFLASHEGIQGTTKPTYYVKLYDDNNLSADVEQSLTYYLCHLYSRCERSVSYPAPTYYAHLAAFRARDHHNALMDGKGTVKKHGDLVRKYGGVSKIPPGEIEKISPSPTEIAQIQNLDLKNYFV